VYDVLRKDHPKSISEIMEEMPFGKSKTTALLRKLVENHYVTIVGSGRGTKYQR
ncbi:MAG: winged helix DNA-binding protein, partial [Lachnospiraceae bacterium]|nr:winged helix DNA-binding protein [Lachnospiraceae bacterium]